MRSLKKASFYLIMLSVPVGAVLGFLYVLGPVVEQRLQVYLLDHLLLTMTEEERQALYAEAAESIKGMWDVVPEPEVARIGRRNTQVTHKQATVRFNNAGMRSSTPYRAKSADAFRIVCLGDSFVFGTAGKEEDRFCNQIGEFYATAGIRADRRRIEAYAVGLGSWTAVQEATYLSHRLTAHDPDIIVVLTVANDVTDLSGVTGTGQITSSFSPQHRAWAHPFFPPICRTSSASRATEP